MKKIILLLLATSTIYAEGVFSVGSKNVGVTVGSDSSFGNSYTVVGANVNYFIVDNLSIGASYQAFLGGDPDINQVTVPVTYHLPLENTTYRPYLGAFYNHTFIDKPYKDYNIYGGRAGLSLQTTPNSFMSFGWVQEFSNSADNTENRGYPEVMGGFSF
jgi:hypothetical protein